MVAGSQPLAAPDNLMDGAPEERNSSKRRRRKGRRGQWGGLGGLNSRETKQEKGEKKAKCGQVSSSTNGR